MIRIYPTVFSGTLSAPLSKPYAQRLLFAAAASNAPTTLYNVPASDDIETTIACLESFGCTILRKNSTTLTVTPFAKTTALRTVDFDFRSSATTSRIALALASAYGIQADCKASESLQKRPLVPLAAVMALRGATFSSFSFPLTMKGRLENGEYILRGDEGSQYISSLLMALPLLPGPSSIRLSTQLLVDGYIDITIDILKNFGITVNRVVDGYDIPGRQTYTTPGSVWVERDWSLGALWLTAGALSQKSGGSIVCNDLPFDSKQGYRNLTEMLSQIITEFKEIYVDAQSCAALVPLIALVAATGMGTVHISNVPQLHYKECDRIKTMATIIKQIGGDAIESEGGLIAKGNGKLTYPEDFFVDCKEDPNILISFALAASVFEKPFLIEEAVVNKTWPDFFKIYKSLGGKYEVVENFIDTETFQAV
ncbi:MAG: hypothetical protein EOM59_10500 [Clostridia bacterium]|nr:hypothetical protein [Clostridia bacterium]